MICWQAGEVLDDAVDDGFGEPGQAVQEAVARGARAARRGRAAPGPGPSAAATRRVSRSSSVESRAERLQGASRRRPGERRGRRWAAPASGRRARAGGRRARCSRARRAPRPGPRPSVSSSSCSRSRRASSPSSTRSLSISSAMRTAARPAAGRRPRRAGHGVLDLQGRQRRRRPRRSRWRNLSRVCSAWPMRSCRRRRLQDVLGVAAVDGDHPHGGRHRDHRHVDRPGHALGRAVAGPGLDGGDRRHWA